MTTARSPTFVDPLCAWNLLWGSLSAPLLSQIHRLMFSGFSASRTSTPRPASPLTSLPTAPAGWGFA